MTLVTASEIAVAESARGFSAPQAVGAAPPAVPKRAQRWPAPRALAALLGGRRGGPSRLTSLPPLPPLRPSRTPSLSHSRLSSFARSAFAGTWDFERRKNRVERKAKKRRCRRRPGKKRSLAVVSSALPPRHSRRLLKTSSSCASSPWSLRHPQVMATNRCVDGPSHFALPRLFLAVPPPPSPHRTSRPRPQPPSKGNPPKKKRQHPW